MLNELYEFKRNLHDQGIFFCFNGPIAQNLVVELGDLLRQKLQLEEAGATTILKAFSLMIEQAQNILHHSDEHIVAGVEGSTTNLNVGIITVGFTDGHNFLVCGNQIETWKVAELKRNLENLRSMDREQLNNAYREQRRKTPVDDGDSGNGAGLGFIEIARKASRPIEFAFREIDARYSFFSFRTVI
jgi:hypothetical protein